MAIKKLVEVWDGKYLIENKCPAPNKPNNIERTYKISEGTFYNQKSEIDRTFEVIRSLS